jgi:hypothetical protein
MCDNYVMIEFLLPCNQPHHYHHAGLGPLSCQVNLPATNSRIPRPGAAIGAFFVKHSADCDNRKLRSPRR